MLVNILRRMEIQGGLNSVASEERSQVKQKRQAQHLMPSHIGVGGAVKNPDICMYDWSLGASYKCVLFWA